MSKAAVWTGLRSMTIVARAVPVAWEEGPGWMACGALER